MRWTGFILTGILSLVVVMNGSETLFEDASRLNDERLASLLERQVRDEENHWYGGFPNRHGLHEPGPAGGFAVERTPDGRLAGNGSGGIWGVSLTPET